MRMLRVLLVAGLVGLLGLLAGCGSVEVPTDTISVGIDPNAVARLASIEPGERLTMLVFNSTLRDLLVAEVVGSNLRVTLSTTFGATLAVSEQREFFARSVASLGDPGPGVGAASILPATFCRGPCVAVEPEIGVRYVLEVWNRSNTLQSVPIYLFGENASDANDRGAATNDNLTTATPIALGNYAGAIEAIGDVDWFHFVGTEEATIAFAANDERIGLRLQFDSSPTLYTPGSTTIIVRPGDRFRIFSNANRAGPSGTSGYFLSVTRP
jgi:hypothetical protein